MQTTNIDLTQLPIPILQGDGALDLLGEQATRAGGTRALIVTDTGIEKAGHVARARQTLEQAGLAVSIFTDVHENPTTRDVDACVEAARAFGADLLIGLGGGSCLDAAKGCNFILTNGGRMEDYWGLDKATQPMLPFIAVPTTAGTGSECQRFALISKEETHQKMACGDPRAAARVAILDPALTLTQPPFVTACTGMDSIAHAVETAVTNVATEASLTYAHEALRLLKSAFPRVLEHPEDLDARSAMQIGAALAGTAIEHSMLGAAHAAANPLTAHFDVIHGQAVGVMLPSVVRFNGRDAAVAKGYKKLAAAANLESGVESLALFLEEQLAGAGLLKPLSGWGVSEKDLDRLAEEAAAQWTAKFNPLNIHPKDFVELYKQVL